MLTPMAQMWNQGKSKAFRGNVIRMLLAISALTILGVAGAWLLGIPLLELVYGVPLAAEKGILLWVMVYGGLNAASVFLYDMIAVTRRQKWLLAAYPLVAVVVGILAPIWVQKQEMLGAILSSVAAQLLLNGRCETEPELPVKSFLQLPVGINLLKEVKHTKHLPKKNLQIHLRLLCFEGRRQMLQHFDLSIPKLLSDLKDRNFQWFCSDFLLSNLRGQNNQKLQVDKQL
jgi:hypothetical protein